MRLKSVVKYYLSEMKTSVMVFYLAMAVVVILFGLMVSVSAGEGEGYSGGGEMASAIFLFVAGLNSFKQNFLFLSINSISRKLQFIGFLIAVLAVCGIMSVIDTAYSNILPLFIDYRSLFIQVYGEWAARQPAVSVILMTFIWNVALYLSTFISGYLITNLYYKMTKLLKIIVSIGVPACFAIILPIIDANVTHWRIYKFIGNMILTLGGLSRGANPCIALASLAAGAAIVGCLSFLLVRRATVKG